METAVLVVCSTIFVIAATVTLAAVLLTMFLPLEGSPDDESVHSDLG